MRTILFGLSILLLGAIAYGEGETPSSNIRYRKHTVIDFSDVLIKGEVKKPTGLLVLKKAHVKFQDLIQTRKDFNQQLFNSVYIVTGD